MAKRRNRTADVILQGDCIEEMDKLPDSCIDLVLCDLPYEIGQFGFEENRNLSLTMLWEQFNRLRRLNTALVFTSVQPFTTALINSQPKMFRYALVWHKTKKTGFLNASRAPLREHEDILVFYEKQPFYDPQGVITREKKMNRKWKGKVGEGYGRAKDEYVSKKTNYPASVLNFASASGVFHPTEKPVDLFEWIIRSYSPRGSVVLDCCAGAGTVAIACIRSNRRFIVIERERENG